MAFIFTLDIYDDTLPSLVSEEEYFVTFDIGYDDVTNVCYKAIVSYVIIPGHPPSERELYFLITSSTDCEDIIEFKHGQQTKSFLVGKQRQLVLSAISLVARHLAEKLSLELIAINTIETYLPPEALTKYEYICAQLQYSGYKAGRVDSFHGSEQWLLKKI